jgi:hypothetical protein
MEVSKMQCPLNYNCQLMGAYTDDEGNTKCENDEACENFGLSWNLPYEYDEDGVLVVTNDPTRFYWEKELNGTKDFNLENPYCPIKGMEAGFYYRTPYINEEEKIDYRQIIRAEWKKAGWEQASPICDGETEAQKRCRKLSAEIKKLIEML